MSNTFDAGAEWNRVTTSLRLESHAPPSPGRREVELEIFFFRSVEKELADVTFPQSLAELPELRRRNKLVRFSENANPERERRVSYRKKEVKGEARRHSKPISGNAEILL